MAGCGNKIGPFNCCTIIEGDCLEVTPEMPDGCVDLVVTDPPYNVGLQYKDYRDSRSGYHDWCISWFKELKRVCRGAIAVTVGQANLSQWATIEPPNWWLAWWKPAAMGRCVVGFNNWEPIALYGKPRKQVFCDVVRATIKPDKRLVGHPCPKPLEWAEKQIEMLSNEGDSVFDPFIGSGTIAVAAKQLGYHFFGCDISAEYVAMAEKRLSTVQMAMQI